ncbi:hypothetical protein [Geitlerinema calcuttense]|uniref:Uncharacterized protein n=1 Tax=Geitlerinema calcuttense NRMC-F 0142 TaxID=2922238 RepID=A0ABT7LV48_9CYAN|nr:hypothetical protein [Geitlerinema calcuttense]MDL5055915.1 hypothetical protein [Geitlerinema calcuttense NRMC-F 0142]
MSQTATKPVLATIPPRTNGKEAERIASESPTTFLERTDRRMSEKVELTKGTLALMGVAIAVITFIISFGGTLLSWARDDQSQREKLNMLIEKTNTILDHQKQSDQKLIQLEKEWQSFQLKQAEKRGYELKAAEGSH